MLSSKQGSDFQDLIRTVLAGSAGGADEATMRDARRFFSFIARLDYSKALNKQFDRWQVRALIKEMRRLLPDLNRHIFSETRIKRLAAKAADLGVKLQAKPYDDGERGRTLRGFYLSGESRKGDPLLFVNTAAHPVEVAAAFWHEVGHHLTHKIFDSGSAALNLTFGADYASHLDSPDELAADLVMTLGCYPKHSAKRLFGARETRGSKAEAMIVSARKYVLASTGLDFDLSSPAQENVYRLAGMIHLAKLRAALLSEYGI